MTTMQCPSFIWCLISTLLLSLVAASEEVDMTISKLRGESATLSCPIDVATCGELQSVTWLKGNAWVAVVYGDGTLQIIEDNYLEKVAIEHQAGTATTSNLHIESVQVSDEDVYVCETQFLNQLDNCKFNNGSYTVRLLVEAPPSAILVTDDSSSNQLYIDRQGHQRNVVLKCLVTGARPAANVTWYNGTQPLDPITNTDKWVIDTKTELQNDGTFETISKLKFVASRFENGIMVQCEADNSVMREGSDQPLHEMVVMEVMYPPVVFVKPDRIEVNETDDILLFCEYEANPATLRQVRWLKDGEVISLNDSRIDGGIPEHIALLVRNANRHDSGSYTCELGNSIGMGTSATAINVHVHVRGKEEDHAP